MHSTISRTVLEQYPRDGYITLPGLLPARVVRGKNGVGYFVITEVLKNGEKGLRNYPVNTRGDLTQIESIREFHRRIACFRSDI